jgi:hypothetical protein
VIVFIVITAVLVVALALVAVGRVTWRLEAQAPPSVYAVDEAVEFVADRLPDEVTAVLTYDDVRSILRWHLEYLRDRGVPARRDLVDGGPVVVEDDEGIAWVLGKADEVGMDITDAEVAVVLETELDYFEAIGAIGGQVPEPPDDVV